LNNFVKENSKKSKPKIHTSKAKAILQAVYIIDIKGTQLEEY
jgi:hypothetical protein